MFLYYIAAASWLARKPTGSLKLEDIVNDRLVIEPEEKEGFIDRIYNLCRTRVDAQSGFILSDKTLGRQL